MIVDEATREFLVESHEGLDQLDREFIAFEADPAQRDRIGTIFRIIHTVKGTAGFLGFTRLEGVTHAAESLLVALRDGSLQMTESIASALLTLVDAVRASLTVIEASGAEPAETHRELIEQFNALRVQSASEDRSASVESLPPLKGNSPPVVGAVTSPATAATPPAQARQPEVEVHTQGAAAVSNRVPPSVPASLESPESTASAAEEVAAPSIADTNVRVDVALLEQLMNLVGELVLARNQILQFGARLEDQSFIGASQRLNLITTELQERVMQTRMQPIRSVWSKLPRVVRDLAVTCGKQVRVEMLGRDTELDRTILEAIKDPLTHIVRNCIDHGIETPGERAQRGKPRTGTLTMNAYHESGQINVEISDDGRGLNLEAIRSKALERGLVAAEQLERMSVHEISQLIFLPGFSTAQKVTNVSGRGVGMDVVKTNVERIGGTVDLVSKESAGTTVRIRIPLTLAIVPALIVMSGGQRFAIPQTNLLELVRLEGETARTGIESVHGTPVYRLRGQLLPLALLRHVLSGAPPMRHGDATWTQGQADENGTVNIVVLQTGTGQLGLVVDEVRDTEEIVVKPLGKELRGIPLFAGATIMGDGRIALILDVAGLAQHVSTARGRVDSGASASSSNDAGRSSDQHSEDALLLFNTSADEIAAVPVSRVTRIEEFARARLERTGQSLVVQYRGEILPLIEVSPESLSSEIGDLPVTVLVFTENGRSIGLIVRRILDVVEERVVIERCTSRHGVLGTIVAQGRVTELLDIQGVIGARAPWFYEGVAA